MTVTQTLRSRWSALAPRERQLIGIACVLVALAFLWWIALGPALRTLAGAQSERQSLDAQLQQMQRLQTQARAMQSQPRRGYDESVAALQAAMRSLGPGARHAASGERVTVTLTGVPPEALAQWLTQVRINASALPSEVRLVRNSSGQWEGAVVLTLPSRG